MMLMAGRQLVAGLALALTSASAGMGILSTGGHTTGAHQHAAASINPSTWAPGRPGAYFFDRSAPSPSSPSDFASREAQFGRKFDGHMYYLPTHVTDADLAGPHWSLTTDHVPFVILSWSTGNNPNSIIPAIVAGKYDSQITSFANAVKTQLSPYGHILIRPFWEFNFTGSEWNDVHYGSNPAIFISAWRHFIGIFRSRHVPNVKWLWNPIRIGGNQAQNPVPYYPGGSYVDWIGIDAYPKKKWLTLQQLATTSVGSSNFDWYRTFSGYGKPLMFGEVGILPANFYGSGAPTRATWWRDALRELQQDLPQVRAIEYFDSNTSYDWRYDASGSAPGDNGTVALEAVKAIAHSCYLDGLSRSCGQVRPRPTASHKRKHKSASPSASISKPTPAATPSGGPTLSAPPAGGPPVGVAAAVAAAVALTFVGAVLAYRRFNRR